MRVRNKFFQTEDQVEVQVSHGELHVLYLTAVCLVGAFSLMKYLGQNPNAFYIYIGATVYVAALVGDTRQHGVEAAYLRVKASEVKAYLVSEGLLRVAPRASEADG